ncbi:hypothetical protein TD95_004916 [Thielaviopsis punctulata]|uniref:Magnesium-dependent phosphatase-1 n=1 Tax=Thielaviopsis punctulata TaxID=72032 RepID=A0A0F4ZGN6_9PEZI|nr:hypothetical protein TD95_004916 [Thielaviopsis punctulata]
MAPKSKPPAPPSTDFLPTSLTHPALPLPPLIVFDLDYTLWPFWVDTHVTPPLKPADAFSATDRAAESFSFYREVPSILHALSRAGIRLAVASRTSAPELARELLKLLHIPAPPPPPSAEADITALDDEMQWEKPRRALELFDAPLEIYPRSKIAHFEAIAKKTGVKYEDMLFFDDESRNREVESLGVTMRLVRDGVTWDEIERGVAEWRKRRGHE